MKMKRSHVIPLSTQVLKILTELHKHTKYSDFLFPSLQSAIKTISGNTLLQALRRLEYPKEIIVIHSFRGIAYTILNENINVHGIHSKVIQIQMAHEEKDKFKSAYNHALNTWKIE